MANNNVNIPRSRPPGRNGVSLTQRAIEIDLGRGNEVGPIGVSPPAPGNSNLFVEDASTVVSSVRHLRFGAGFLVTKPSPYIADVTYDQPYKYLHITLEGMNIGGSNETERVRRRVDLTEWEEGMITCCATSDIGGFDQSAEWYDGAAWQPLGPTLTFPPSGDIDLTSGFEEGTWAALDPDAITNGWSIIRVNTTSDSTADDIYGLEIIFRRAMV